MALRLHDRVVDHSTEEKYEKMIKKILIAKIEQTYESLHFAK